MADEPQFIQTVTLVLENGDRVTFSGRPQIPVDTEARVVEVIVSHPERLPGGMVWDTLPKESE